MLIDDSSRLSQFLQKSSYKLLGIAFIPLHYSIWNPEDTIFSNTLFLIHIGLFLFWQPFINHKTQIRTRPTIILILSIFGTIYLGGSWAQTIWIVFLIGIMSSYRVSTLTDKLIYITIIGYLLIELFGGLIPKNIQTDQELLNDQFIMYLTLGINLIIILAPIKASSLRNYSSDLLYSIVSVSIVVLIALTTVIWMSKTDNDYYISLIYSFMTLAAILIVFNLIFRPNSEFGLIAQLRNRYLLNLGTPFESFLMEIADISNDTDNPDDFLFAAFEKLTLLNWINGFSWVDESGSKEVGLINKHKYEFSFDDLTVSVYGAHELGPSMQLHSKLLIQIIFIFYSSKRREIALSRRAHMEAIYDTGARLTHDMKNLLQSLTLMLSTVTSQKPVSNDLFVRNMENITLRLRQTLAKLKNPEQYSNQQISLSEWWNALKDRLQQDNISYKENIETDKEIPEEVFDTVVDNLINNALKKQKKETDININVELDSTDNILQIKISDTGSKVPDSIAKDLFNAPVKSKSGFGIGLYQATKQAINHNYELTLSDNDQGHVSFTFQLHKDVA